MIAGFGIICVILGTTAAYCADSFPRRQATIELIAGFLLIGGFGLLGYALSTIGHPGFRSS